MHYGEYVRHVLGIDINICIVCACSLEHKNHIATFSGFCKQTAHLHRTTVLCVKWCGQNIVCVRSYYIYLCDVLISTKRNIGHKQISLNGILFWSLCLWKLEPTWICWGSEHFCVRRQFKFTLFLKSQAYFVPLLSVSLWVEHFPF